MFSPIVRNYNRLKIFVNSSLSRSDTTTDIWSAIYNNAFYGYLVASFLITFILIKNKIDSRVAYVVFSYIAYSLFQFCQ